MLLYRIPPPQKKKKPRHDGKKLECNWGRGIGWDIDSLQSGEIVHPITKHCAAQCARHCNFFVCSWLIRPLEPGWELSFDLWICKFYPNLDAKKSEGEIAHQIIKHCMDCRDSFHCTKHKSICQWLVWFGHCIYGFPTKKIMCAVVGIAFKDRKNVCPRPLASFASTSTWQLSLIHGCPEFEEEKKSSAN